VIVDTKYDYGQHLYCLTRSNVDLPAVCCDACEGEKVVVVRGEKFSCPKCGGKGVLVKTAHGWIVGGSGTVGHVRATRARVDNFTNFEWWEPEPVEGSLLTRVEYMLDSTGVGSGTIWPEGNLFPSRESAQAEADSRNDYVRAGSRKPMSPAAKLAWDTLTAANNAALEANK
jgi:hypothetical protein